MHICSFLFMHGYSPVFRIDLLNIIKDLSKGKVRLYYEDEPERLDFLRIFLYICIFVSLTYLLYTICIRCLRPACIKLCKIL